MTTIYVEKGTILPERIQNDVYPTEKTLIRAALECMAKDAAGPILDAGAGDGRWGQIAQQVTSKETWGWEATGIDIRNLPMPPGYSYWFPNQDFLTFPMGPFFGLIVGNPPYAFAEEFVRKGWSMLHHGGTMIYLLRLSFMEGVGRNAGLWSELPPYEVSICSRRPSFYDGRTNATAYAVYMWKKDGSGNVIGTPGAWRTSLLIHERDKENL